MFQSPIGWGLSCELGVELVFFDGEMSFNPLLVGV